MTGLIRNPAALQLTSSSISVGCIHMPELTHLPPDCFTDDIIEVLERDGAAIVDGFVSNIWLAEFNNAIQMPIDHYTPYDYG